jgi:hypothetical protein
LRAAFLGFSTAYEGIPRNYAVLHEPADGVLQKNPAKKFKKDLTPVAYLSFIALNTLNI